MLLPFLHLGEENLAEVGEDVHLRPNLEEEVDEVGIALRLEDLCLGGQVPPSPRHQLIVPGYQQLGIAQAQHWPAWVRGHPPFLYCEVENPNYNSALVISL